VTLALAFLLAAGLHIGLRAASMWWFFGACQPLLLVTVAASRRYTPAGVGWWGLAAGLAIDVLSDRIIGPGGIAVAAAAAAVAVLVRRFELAGPLFWIGGALFAALGSELLLAGLLVTLDAPADHGPLGSLAVIATTAALGMLVAAGERIVVWWRSPERARRRELKRL
jgi:hypothetical protein